MIEVPSFFYTRKVLERTFRQTGNNFATGRSQKRVREARFVLEEILCQSYTRYWESICRKLSDEDDFLIR